MTQDSTLQVYLHSDLHLESGPFTFAPMDANGVVVIAGDVCSSSQGPAALRASCANPIVYVAGNHEFWGADYFERLADIESEAQKHQVCFLENRAAVVNGVRFLGATLWTNYGDGDPALLHYGLRGMRDNQNIRASRWWTDKNRCRFRRIFGDGAVATYEGLFNPLLALDLHRRSMAWLKRELKRAFRGPTVVVTHHAPSFESLLRSGVRPHSIERSAWEHRLRGDDALVKVASYASDIVPSLESELAGAGVRHWLHGHVHQHFHYARHGLQVACNPRGRVHGALTEEKARSYRLWGLHISPADIQRSQERFSANPEVGDGRDYDKSFVITLAEPGFEVIRDAHEDAIEQLESALVELRSLQRLVRSRRAAIRNLAGHRADTLCNAAQKVVQEFAQNMAEQLCLGGLQADRFDWLLDQVQLTRDLWEFSEFNYPSDYDFVLARRLAESENEGALKSSHTLRHPSPSADEHLNQALQRVKKLIRALRRVPKACQVLKNRYLQGRWS